MATQTHNLFVIVGGSRDATAATVRVLQFIAHCKPWLMKMRIQVEVQKIRPEHLKSKKLVATLTKAGIKEFPALKSPRRLYLGAKRIMEVYDMVIRDFKRASQQEASGMSKTQIAEARRGLEFDGSATMDDIYRNYFADELSMGAAERDGGDPGMAETDSMMADYHKMIKRRAQTAEKRGGAAYVSKPGAPPRPAEGPSNVEDDALIDRLIATATAPVTQETLDAAFGQGADAESSREDLMLSAFWSNQEESI